MFKRFLKKILFKFGYKVSKIESKETLNIVGVDEKIKDIILKSSNFSMTGKIRMFVLSEAIKNIKNNSIMGDFVECGVWRGGNLILMNELNRHYNLKKKFLVMIHLTVCQNLQILIWILIMFLRKKD